MQQRSTTIDAVRGICLVNIFVNHIENGYLTNLSPSGLGFSDSADIFVLLSGISVALAARQTEARALGRSSYTSGGAQLTSMGLRSFSFWQPWVSSRRSLPSAAWKGFMPRRRVCFGITAFATSSGTR